MVVEIHLNDQETQIPFLSIPLSDVQRLSIHPFKWLKFVLFSICGARGDLSAMPDGPPVDYDSTALDDNVTYFYTPSGNCIFVDHEGLNDRLTSTEQTMRRAGFREDVLRRDGFFCVITRIYAENCDAAHLIPMGKNDEYIRRVVEDRSPLYDDTPPSISRIKINAVQNGVLLRKDLHAMLGRGDVAFLKTPNVPSGLQPTDIPRVDQDFHRPNHFTLQQLKAPHYDPVGAEALAAVGRLHTNSAFGLGLGVDALFQGDTESGSTESLLPPAIILDYVYGVAAYKRWNSMRHAHEVHYLVKNYREKHYVHIPALPPSPSKGDDDDDPLDESDDSNDPDWVPGDETDGPSDPDRLPPTSPQQRRYMSVRRGDEMAEAMDKLNSVIMAFRGITPEEAANRREKRMMEEELKIQEASRSKVTEWMKTTEVDS